MASSSSSSSSSVALSFLYQNPIKASLSIPKALSPYSKLTFPSIATFYSAIPRFDYSNFRKINPCLHCSNLPTASTNNTHYEVIFYFSFKYMNTLIIDSLGCYAKFIFFWGKLYSTFLPLTYATYHYVQSNNRFV